MPLPAQRPPNYYVCSTVGTPKILILKIYPAHRTATAIDKRARLVCTQEQRKQISDGWNAAETHCQSAQNIAHHCTIYVLLLFKRA
jgi:hypothetical protein